MGTVTKKELTRVIAQEMRGGREQALGLVSSLFDSMREQLEEGNRIEIRGFGVFTVKDTKPKPAARNPRTGEITPVPARRKVHFKPGMLLKQALHTPLTDSDDSPKEGIALSLRDTISKVLRRRRNRWMTYDEICADMEQLELVERTRDVRKKIPVQVSRHKELFEKESGRPVRVRLSEVGLTRPLPKTKNKES